MREFLYNRVISWVHIILSQIDIRVMLHRIAGSLYGFKNPSGIENVVFVTCLCHACIKRYENLVMSNNQMVQGK